MTGFKKFNSLTLLRPERVEETLNAEIAFGDSRCVVTEKIQGANMAVEAADGEVFYYRRRGELHADDEFYGFQFVAKHIEPKIRAMFDSLKELSETSWAAYDSVMEHDGVAKAPDIPREVKSVKLVGEFFGGHYPNTEQVKDGAGQVGKGKIWYSQQKSFMAFELLINDVPQDVYSLGSLCQSFGIPTVPFLFFGTFNECLTYSEKYLNSPTEVPRMIPLLDKNGEFILDADGNLQSLPFIEDNNREGHVIMPTEPKWFFNGKRMMLKHKSKVAQERKERKEPPRLLPFTEHQKHVYGELSAHITTPRIEAVISKELEVSIKDLNRIAGLVVEDALESCWNDGYSIFGHHWGQLSSKERKQVTKRVNKETIMLVKPLL